MPGFYSYAVHWKTFVYVPGVRSKFKAYLCLWRLQKAKKSAAEALAKEGVDAITYTLISPNKDNPYCQIMAEGFSKKPLINTRGEIVYPEPKCHK